MIKMCSNRKSWPLVKSTKSDTTFNRNHFRCKQLNNWLQLYLSDFMTIVLKVILCFFLIPIIIPSSTVNAKRLNSGIHGTKHHPKFIGSVENITIPIGKEATLTCNVENLGNHRVAWLRADPEVTLLTLETSIIVKDNRLRVTNDINKLWSLHIKNVTENDRGTYMCEVNSEPMISRKAYLDILVPPSIVDNETSSDTVLDERSKLSLHCKANGYPTPVIIWRREDGKNLSTGFIGASKVEGEYLNISQVTRDDMGAYLCIASNGVLPSRSKRIFVQVNFPPKIRAGQLSFGAAKGSHVDLQCEVEASPKPMTSWIRKDQMLFASKKYKIEEIVNFYNVTMKLRINDLEEKDFAAYKCVAKNTLGEREGRLRVYEIPSTTPFPVRSTSSTHKPSRKVFTASTATIFSPGNNRKDEKVKSNSMREMAQKRESLNGNNVNKKSNYDQTNVFSGSNEIKSSGVMIKQLGYNGLKILTMAGFITLFTWW